MEDAETTEADADAIIMAADVIMDVITAGAFPVEITPAAISCGSSFCCVCAEITAVDATTDAATEMVTAAGSLSSFCFSAVDGGMAAAADLSFPHMKKGCLLSPFQKNRDSGNFPLSPFSGIF